MGDSHGEFAIFAPRHLAVVCLCFATLFWSGNNVIGRAFHADISPIVLAFWRWSLAFLLVAPFALRYAVKDRLLIFQSWKRLTLLSILGISSFNTLLYQAVHTSTAIQIGLIQIIMPVLIVLFSYLFHGERLNTVKQMGVALTVVAAVNIVVKGDPAGLNILPEPGNFWMLTAVVCYALYSVLLRKAPPIHPLSMISVTFLVGALILCIPMALLTPATDILPPKTAWSGILYIAIFPSILSYLFWNRAVTVLGANKTGVFIGLVPAFTVVISTVMLHETLQLYQLASFTLIIAGIVIVNRPVPDAAAH